MLSTRAFADAGSPCPVSLELLEMLLAGLVCGVLAVVVGVPALRLGGIHLALATIAFVEVVRVLPLNLPITGGAIGIFGIPQPFTTKLGYLAVAGPLLVVVAAFGIRLEQIRIGRAFLALREDELAASSVGVRPTPIKGLAVVCGALVAGVAGALSAHFLNTWNARQGTFDASIAYLAFVLIGGVSDGARACRRGPRPDGAPRGAAGARAGRGPAGADRQFLVDGRLIVYGVLLALACVFFPRGLVTPELVYRRVAARARRQAVELEGTAS